MICKLKGAGHCMHIGKTHDQQYLNGAKLRHSDLHKMTADVGLPDAVFRVHFTGAFSEMHP